MDVPDSRIVAEAVADGVQRYYVFRIVVLYRGKVAELPLYGIVGSEEIRYLNVYALIRFGGDEVDFSGAQDTYSDLEALTAEMIPDYILHDFLYASPNVGAA